MALQRVRLNRAGVRQVLTSDGVRDDLRRRMQVAASSSGGTVETDLSDEPRSWARARARVVVNDRDVIYSPSKRSAFAATLDQARSA